MKRFVYVRSFICLMMCIIFLTGCSFRLAGMTVLSTRNVALNKVDLDKMPQVKGVKGEDSKWVVLGIPLGFPHLENAVDDALIKGGGDVMTDAVIQMEMWTILLFGQHAITVKGTVVNSRGGETK